MSKLRESISGIRNQARDRFAKPKNNSQLKGLSQSRFQQNAGNTHLKTSKVRRYKNKPDTVHSISSGSLILSIGLLITFTGYALSLSSFSSGIIGLIYSGQGGIFGILNLFTIIILGIVLDPFSVIPGMTSGWFLGGFLSGLIYKVEGKRGPLYSAYLAFSITMSIAFLLGMVLISSETGGFDGSVSGLMGLFLFQMVSIGMVVSILSIPLSIIAWIGYKIGNLISMR